VARCGSRSVRESDCASVVVSDNGRGISPQHLPNIFRPFYTTKGNGTGLGLSLARRIVEEHHGRIEVSSEVGKGSKLYPPNRPGASAAWGQESRLFFRRALPFVFVPEVEAEMRVRFRAVDLHRNLGTGAVLAEKWVDRFQQ
jgi:signal transduction histidine kinase